MARISDAIGYDVEVSEPNGPTVHGYITVRWADSRQPEFDAWLNEVKADLLHEVADLYDTLQTRDNDHYSRRDPSLWLHDEANHFVETPNGR